MGGLGWRWLDVGMALARCGERVILAKTGFGRCGQTGNSPCEGRCNLGRFETCPYLPRVTFESEREGKWRGLLFTGFPGARE